MDTVTFGALFLGTFLLLPPEDQKYKCPFLCEEQGLISRSAYCSVLAWCFSWALIEVHYKPSIYFVAVRLRSYTEQSGAVYCQVGFNSYISNSAESLFLEWREDTRVVTACQVLLTSQPSWRLESDKPFTREDDFFWRPLRPHQSATGNRTFALMSVEDGSSFNWWERRMCFTIFVFLAKTGTMTLKSTPAARQPL